MTGSDIDERVQKRHREGKSITKPAFLGVDPGLGGGMALVVGSGPAASVRLCPLSGTLKDAWEFVEAAAERIRRFGGFAWVEEQSPRPTRWWDAKAKRWQGSILKSTCLLWGSYREALAMLTAAGIPHETVLPRRWQEAVMVPKRAKPETEGQWKARLKSKAASIFPDERATLWNADALLIAEACRRARAERGER